MKKKLFKSSISLCLVVAFLLTLSLSSVAAGPPEHSNAPEDAEPPEDIDLMSLEIEGYENVNSIVNKFVEEKEMNLNEKPYFFKDILFGEHKELEEKIASHSDANKSDLNRYAIKAIEKINQVPNRHTKDEEEKTYFSKDSAIKEINDLIYSLPENRQDQILDALSANTIDCDVEVPDNYYKIKKEVEEQVSFTQEHWDILESLPKAVEIEIVKALKEYSSELKEFDSKENELNFSYSPISAIQYAYNNAEDGDKKRNDDYPDFDLNCTNFVSQVAYEGGGVPQEGSGSCGYENTTTEWYVNSSAWWCVLRDFAWSTSWSVASDFPIYHTNNYANWVGVYSYDEISELRDDANIGDFVGIGDSTNINDIFHQMVVTTEEEEDIKLTYHSGPGNLDYVDNPLSDIKQTDKTYFLMSFY